MIDDEGKPQLCDFGLISIFLEEGHSGMTTTSQHTGTDRYLAYELVRDGDTVVPTTSSDIFALGCIGLEVRLPDEIRLTE
jgi:serine/threonine protein kinase